MIIFPEPQKIETIGEPVVVSGAGKPACGVVLPAEATPLERAASRVLCDAVHGAQVGDGGATGGVPILLGAAALDVAGMQAALDGLPDNPEAYALVVGEEGIALAGRGPAGTFYAAQTLRRLLIEGEAGAQLLPGVVVTDWPDFRYRGLYIESKWGPDLMTLQDWKDLVDYMAGLKFNSLGVGVYCCWCVQYGGKRTEFLMVPFPDHPELKTPKTIRFYSARDEAWRSRTYLPVMFEEDFFGELVAYAKARNITVRPHFNGPGHTTLIPHTHPEVAAKDAAGTPKPYGYCLSSPKTYELLFDLWDQIIDRYLAPSGIDWFHMGLDEIWPMVGADEADPERRVDPWCACAECRQRTPNERLVDYVVKATQHLKEKGIKNICIWNDHLARHGVLDEAFVQRLEDAGVRDNVILQWWRYDEPVLEIPPELGLRAWTTPMAGYYFWLFTQSYTSNIYPHLALGHRAGAEGADAYCVYDPVYDRNYTCLAEYGWNQSSTGDLYQFKSRYARQLLGVEGFDAVEPFEKWDQVYDSMPLMSSTLDILLPYWHTYSSARTVYPANVVQDLLRDRLRTRVTHRKARTHLTRARDLFAARRETATNPALVDEYVFECERLVAVVDVYDRILAAVAACDNDDGDGLATAAAELTAGLEVLDGVMVRAEEVKAPYLQPQLLRDMSSLRSYVAELAAAVETAGDLVTARDDLRALVGRGAA